MDRVIYIAMNGAQQATLKQNVHSNNLANASTVGFKKELAYQTNYSVGGFGHQVRETAVTQAPLSDFKPGPIISTGRQLDVAIEDEGFIAVQNNDGSEAYTRSGELKLTPEGLLMTKHNYPVMADGGPIIIPPADRMMISRDGAISIKPAGSETETMVVIGQIKLVNPPISSLRKLENGLFISTQGDVLEPSPDVTLMSNSLEGSNVNLIGELVSMIETSRHYETQVKLMAAADNKDKTAARVMDVR